MKYSPVGQTPVCMVYRARFYGDKEIDVVMQLGAVSLEKMPKPALFECRVPPGAAVEDIDKER
jgi:hypothetical protein